jgi:hypothetical protein
MLEVMRTAEPAHIEGLGVVVVMSISFFAAADLAWQPNQTTFSDRFVHRLPDLGLFLVSR